MAGFVADQSVSVRHQSSHQYEHLFVGMYADVNCLHCITVVQFEGLETMKTQAGKMYATYSTIGQAVVRSR